MRSSVRPYLSRAVLLSATVLGACTDAASPTTPLAPTGISRQGGSGGGGGGGGGGGDGRGAGGTCLVPFSLGSQPFAMF
jgi:hypothetical protein